MPGDIDALVSQSTTVMPASAGAEAPPLCAAGSLRAGVRTLGGWCGKLGHGYPVGFDAVEKRDG
jgi:hypothetical protein